MCSGWCESCACDCNASHKPLLAGAAALCVECIKKGSCCGEQEVIAHYWVEGLGSCPAVWPHITACCSSQHQHALVSDLAQSHIGAGHQSSTAQGLTHSPSCYCPPTISSSTSAIRWT